MLAVTFIQGLLATLFCLICLLLILLILIQRGRGGGLSGAFGGVGSYSPFGTKTGDALTWATVVLTAMYLLVAVVANYYFLPQELTDLAAPAVQIPADQPTGSTPNPAEQPAGGAGPSGQGAATPAQAPAGAPGQPADAASGGAADSPAKQPGR